MSKFESEIRDHALSLLHQDYFLLEKQIRELSERLSIELRLITDSARTIPENINKSLVTIADAVEEAEKTAASLGQQARDAIAAIKNGEIEAIRREVLSELSKELAATQEVAANIRKTLLSYPNAFRPKAPVGPLVILAAFTFAAVLGGSIFSWNMYQQNAELNRNVIQVYMKYNEQQKVIQALPPEYRNKFPK